MPKLTYAQQIKADRRAAAAERRQNDFRKDAGYVKAYQHQETQKTKMETKTKICSISRRISGRYANLKAVGKGFNDAHLWAMEAMAAAYTNDELLAKGRGQTALLRSIDSQVNSTFGLTQTVVTGLQDDPGSEQINEWGAWFVDEADASMVKDYIHQLVTEHKAAA